jgi:hypothetical protein
MQPINICGLVPVSRTGNGLYYLYLLYLQVSKVKVDSFYQKKSLPPKMKSKFTHHPYITDWHFTINDSFLSFCEDISNL